MLTSQVPPSKTSNASMNHPRPRLRLPDTNRFSQTAFLNSRLPLIKVSSPSPLRLTSLSSNFISLVSWTPLHAEPSLITLLLLSVMVPMLPPAKNTTSSETHGVLPGVTKVISRSPPSRAKVSAESKCRTPTHHLTEPNRVQDAGAEHPQHAE